MSSTLAPTGFRCRPPGAAGRALCLAVLLVASAAPVQAQQGLHLSAPPASLPPDAAVGREALRLRLGEVSLDVGYAGPGGALARAHLFGDYFFTGPGFGHGDVAGGLRLTSGLMLGPAHDTANQPPPRLKGALAIRPVVPAGMRDLDPGQRVALPYIGLGYTSASVREGWGLSADIGLGGMRPGERLRLGQPGGVAAQAERVLNDLRLAPVVQIGVSYAF
jgi:hypothetical protein